MHLYQDAIGGLTVKHGHKVFDVRMNDTLLGTTGLSLEAGLSGSQKASCLVEHKGLRSAVETAKKAQKENGEREMKMANN